MFNHILFTNKPQKSVNTSMENYIILNIVDDELVEEGLGQMVQLGVLASVLGFAGIVNAQDFKTNITRQCD